MGNASVLVRDNMAICYPESFGEMGGTSPVPEPRVTDLPTSSSDLRLANVLLDCMNYAQGFEKYDGWDDPQELDLAASKLGFKNDDDLRRKGLFVYVEEINGEIFMYPTVRRGRKSVSFTGVAEIRSPSSAPGDVMQTFLDALARCK